MHFKLKEESPIHISHLHRYVSAYVTDKQTVTDLVSDISYALTIAKDKKETQIVHQDGEFCFHVYPSGIIVLMIPWREYTIYGG